MGTMGTNTFLGEVTPSLLYQRCASLRARLLLVRGLGTYFGIAANGKIEASQFSDPVTQLWDLFSLGISLCYIFDQLPVTDGFRRINHSEYNPLIYNVDPDREKKSAVALFAMEIRSPLFLNAIPECIPFTLEEIWDRRSANGLAKVVQTVEAIVNHLPVDVFNAWPSSPSPKFTYRTMASACSSKSESTPPQLPANSPDRCHALSAESNKEIAHENLTENLHAYVDLEDWKGLHPEALGGLLLSDFLVYTGASKADTTCRAFLFERFILFCEVNVLEDPHHGLINQYMITERQFHDFHAVSGDATSFVSSQGDGTLRLKYHISLANVSAVLSLQPRHATAASTTTQYPLTIWWKDNTVVEHMTLKCNSEGQRMQWESYINNASRECRLRDALTNTNTSSLSRSAEGRRASEPRQLSPPNHVNHGSTAPSSRHSYPSFKSHPHSSDSSMASEGYRLARQRLFEILDDDNKKALITHLQGEEAQCTVDFLNTVLHEHGMIQTNEGRCILQLLSKLARSARLFPRSYELKGVELETARPQGGGGFADIYKGIYGDQILCLKAVRQFRQQDNSKLFSAHVKELTLWAQLAHENILPFYGVYLLSHSLQRVCLVSPWMKNGDLSNYLDTYPDRPRLPLASDVISGLQYLHNSNIVHGDLKAKNVLVSDEGRALLADFGLSRVVISTGLATTQLSLGTTRWTAPELLADESEDYVPPTPKSDIWSLGCLLYEIFTRKIPFYQYNNEFRILTAIVKSRENPIRPENVDEPLGAVFDRLWNLMSRCWDYEPLRRPDCQNVLEVLTAIMALDSGEPVSFGKIGESDSLTFWETMKEKSESPIDYFHVFKILLRVSANVSELSSLAF